MIVGPIAAEDHELIVSFASGGFLAALHGAEKIGDPRHHRVGFDKVIGENGEEIFIILEVTELYGNFNDIFLLERTFQSVPEIFEPQTPRRIRQRRVEDQSQSDQQIRLSDFVFPKHDRVLAELHIEGFEVAKILDDDSADPHNCRLPLLYRIVPAARVRRPYVLLWMTGVSGKAWTFSRPCRTDKLDHPFHMLRQDPHPAVLQRAEYRVGERAGAERPANVSMRQDVDRAVDPEFRKQFRAKTRRLALVDNGNRPASGGVGDRGGLAVVEGFYGRPDNQPFEMRVGFVVETNDLDQLFRDKRFEDVRIKSAALSSPVEFLRHHVRHKKSVRQCAQDFMRAPRCAEVDYGTRVADKSCRVSQAVSRPHRSRSLLPPARSEFRASLSDRGPRAGRVVLR